MKQLNNDLMLLSNNQLADVIGGECITETLKEHPIKVALFGWIYVAGVAYGCYA